jgi:hypothetical protein
MIQDGTGSRVPIFPAAVVETVTVSQTASSTTILTCRTNDGGTSYHVIPALRGSISLSGGTSFANTALSNLASPTLNTDLSFNSYDAKLVDRIEFTSSSGAVSAASTATIYLDSGGSMTANVATGDSFVVTVNNSATVPFSVNSTGAISMTILPLNSSQNIGGAGFDFGAVYANIFDTGAAAPADAGVIRCGNTEVINWRNAANSANVGITVNGSDEITLTGDLNVGTFDINTLDTLVFDQAAGAAFGTTRTGIKSDAGSDLNFFIPLGSQHKWYEAGVAQALLNNISNVATLELQDSLGAELILAETTGSTTGSILKGTAAMQYTDPTLHEFLVGVTATFQIASTGLDIVEMLKPVAPAANYGRVYVKNITGTQTAPFYQDEAGTETNMLLGQEIPIWTQTHDANGNDFILDLDGDTKIENNVDDTFELFTGGTARFTVNNAGGIFSGPLTTLSAFRVDGATNLNGAVDIGDASTDVINIYGNCTVQNNITFGSSGVDTISYVGKIDTDVLLVGGNVFKSQNTTEIGFQVTNASLTVGSKGSIQMPNATTGVSTTKAALSTAFGDVVGCFGIIEIASTLTLFVKQSNGNWGQVSLTYDAVTS